MDKFTPDVVPFSITHNSKIDPDQLNAFAQGIANSMSQLALILNDAIKPIIDSLPASYDPENESFDGKALYVDSGATENDNAGLLYYTDPNTPANSRPVTIYESILIIIQMLANIDNGLKEGIKIPSTSSESIANGQTLTYDWPFNDYMFKDMLFIINGSDVEPITTLDISVDTTTQELNITNNTGATVNIFGYVWHPVLNL